VVPSSLRSRIALFALLGVFLVPIYTSSLNGLTHVLTCKQRTSAPFTLEVPAQGSPTILSAVTIRRGAKQGLCGGLSLDLAVQELAPGKVRVVLPLTNHTRYRWRGSVELVLGHTSVPVAVGEVAPGGTRLGHVDVHIDRGVHELGGSLLIGP
jgi:hypothetical protein